MRTIVSLHQEQYFIRLYENAFDRDFRYVLPKRYLCSLIDSSFSF